MNWAPATTGYDEVFEADGWFRCEFAVRCSDKLRGVPLACFCNLLHTQE